MTDTELIQKLRDLHLQWTRDDYLCPNVLIDAAEALAEQQQELVRLRELAWNLDKDKSAQQQEIEKLRQSLDYEADDKVTEYNRGYRTARAEVSEWQPIETAPKDGTRFIAFGTLHDDGPWMGETPHAMVAWWHSGGWYSCMLGAVDGLSHWMPLPPPPESKT